MTNASPRSVLVCVLCLTFGWTIPATAADAPSSGPDDFPVHRIVLFTSGVGFFEHRGQINGDRDLSLAFHASEISDLLKSLVVQDLSGGRVTAVTYESPEPTETTLRSFSIDLTANPSIADLLQQVRGHDVRVVAGETFEGAVVGVESRRQLVGAELTEVQGLMLNTNDGLVSVPMFQIRSVRLLDRTMNRELNEALQVLAAARQHDQKSVQLHFRGRGNRDVSMGYVREFPLWKTSYRLGVRQEDSPFLQGWAIVENVTEEDWDNVQLALVSGRPVSFMMDLYRSVYLQRPEVQLQLHSSVGSVLHGRDLWADLTKSNSRYPADDYGDEYGESQSGGDAGGGGFGGFGGGMGGGYGGGFGGGGAGAARQGEAAAFDPAQGVAAAASGSEVGELFRYTIEDPVSLARQRSAMLPIVNEPIECHKLSIYNPGTHTKHPMNGLRMVNTTDLHLMQGPITVFDEGEYAGDAQIADLAPGEKRLVSYALDLEVEVDRTVTKPTRRFASARIRKGVLHVAYRTTRTSQYIVSNASSKRRAILLEQAIDDAWQLVTPAKPDEVTRDLYRFSIEVAAGTTEETFIQEAQETVEQLALADLGEDKLVDLRGRLDLPAAVDEALQEILQRKRMIAALEDSHQALLSKLAEIAVEQTRIRQNMLALDQTSPLYRRYLEKLTAQETQLEQLRQESHNARAALSQQNRDWKQYLSELSTP